MHAPACSCIRIILKDYVRAEIAFKQAVALRPHYGKAYFNLGLLYFQLEKLEQGFECFKKCCLEADLDNEMGFSGYAEASMKLGKYEEAIFASKKVLQINPQSPHGLFNLANAYFCAKQFESARELYEALHRADPKHEQVCYNLAETYFNLELTKKSMNMFKHLLSLSGKLNPQVCLRLAACQEKLGNPQLACATLNQLLAQTKDEGIQQMVKGAVAQLTEHYKLT
jgi:tetratricopeptide (TPR) repeat protein